MSTFRRLKPLVLPPVRAAKTLTLDRQTLRLPRRSGKMVGSTLRKVQDMTYRGRPVRPFVELVVELELCGDADG